MHQLFRDFKESYNSVSREVLYNTLIQFGIPMELVRLIKMCLTETYSKVRLGKNLSDMFPIRNGLKQGDALTPLLFNFALEYAMDGSGRPGWLEIKTVHINFWFILMMLVYWEKVYIR